MWVSRHLIEATWKVDWRRIPAAVNCAKLFVRRLQMTCSRIALACVVLLAAAAQVSAAEPRRVLLLHSFSHPSSPWTDIAGSFRAEIVRKSPEPIDLYEVSLDSARIRGPDDEKPYVEYIRALLAGRTPELIVPIGAPAASFVEGYRTEFGADARVLIVGADQRRIPGPINDSETSVLFDLDLAAYLRNILQLLPGLRNVAVVIGRSPVEKFWTAEMKRAFEPFSDRVSIEWLNDLTFDEILQHASALPTNSALIWGLLSEDAAGVSYAWDRELERMHDVSDVPIFGIGDYEMGRGVVGGFLLQTQKLGEAAAAVGLRILKGESPGTIHTPPLGLGPPTYDARELLRWNISEERLPPGSIVQYRQRIIWEQYRWQILGVVAIVIGQTLLIAYVLFQSRRRRRAEAEATERHHEVAHLMRVSALGELSGAMAHEINQPLTAILSNAQAALRLLGQKSPNLTEIREAVEDIVSEDNRAGAVIGQLRSLLKKGEHKSEAVDLNELVLSTLALLHSELIRRRIEVETQMADDLPMAGGDSVQLQQVLLNLFMNAMDAMASTPDALRRITVSARGMPNGMIRLRVLDNGTGIKEGEQERLFKPFHTSKAHGLGLGLTICSTIARAHGGKLTLENHTRGGAVATLSLPTREISVSAR
jgi:signal transduction histidine kinase